MCAIGTEDDILGFRIETLIHTLLVNIPTQAIYRALLPYVSPNPGTSLCLTHIMFNILLHVPPPDNTILVIHEHRNLTLCFPFMLPGKPLGIKGIPLLSQTCS